MEIIALKQYTDKYISLYEGEIRNVADWLATKLITGGVVQQHSGEVLPSVSSTDNGKILAVVGGSWAKADAPSGGSDQFIVSTVETDTDVFSQLSHTHTEIVQAINEGKNIVLEIRSAVTGIPSGEVFRAYINNFGREVVEGTTSGDAADDMSIRFMLTYMASSILVVKEFSLSPEDSFTVSSGQIQLTTT